jgi:NAD(P)-dependent dehydrogenase (short-subunit alcohol dehydrogenase family)
VDQISAAEGLAHSVLMDVTAPEGIEGAFEAAEERFGPVQIVVNNAGVTSTCLALEQDEASWDKVLAPEMLLKPFQCGAARRVEARQIWVEMAARNHHKVLGSWARSQTLHISRAIPVTDDRSAPR